MNTQTAPNFNALLGEAPTEVIRPKPYPAGNYLSVVVGLPKYDKSSQKQTEYAEFELKPVQPLDDVDGEALAGWVELNGPVGSKTLKDKMYLTENAIYRLDEFHQACGIDLADGQSRRQRNEAVVGRQVIVTVKHEASSDGKSVFARVAGYAQVED